MSPGLIVLYSEVSKSRTHALTHDVPCLCLTQAAKLDGPTRWHRWRRPQAATRSATGPPDPAAGSAGVARLARRNLRPSPLGHSHPPAGARPPADRRLPCEPGRRAAEGRRVVGPCRTRTTAARTWRPRAGRRGQSLRAVPTCLAGTCPETMRTSSSASSAEIATARKRLPRMKALTCSTERAATACRKKTLEAT
eukprot:scaffold17565_cov69-Phaeocystis_antarctica.AAC.3